MSSNVVGFIPPVDVVDSAKVYLKRGWMPLPVPQGEKNPSRDEWQKFQTTESRVEEDFKGRNVGLLTGHPSNRLYDVDLDSLDAVKLAPFLLPPTDLISGRGAKPRSHYWYVPDEEIPYVRLLDPGEGSGKKTLIELRGDGRQTLVAPSRHPSGDTYGWNSFGKPADTPAGLLQRAVHKIAAGCLLVQHWRDGLRHELTMCLAGSLIRSGWDEQEIETFIIAVASAAGDPEITDRVKATHDTISTYKSGTPTTGIPTLSNHLGPITDHIVKWLSIETKPVINISTDLKKMMDDSIKALANAHEENVFYRGYHLVHIHTPSKKKSVANQDHAPEIALIPLPQLKTKLSSAIKWRKWKEAKEGGGEWLPATPPKDTVEAVATAGMWPEMRALQGIVETPTVLPSGRIITTPGYDEESGLLYRPLHEIEVPQTATYEDAIEARDLLLNIVSDFPFASLAHRSAWLSAVLTPICRYAFDGPTPLFLMDANTRGTGKSLLTRTTCIIAAGRIPAPTIWPKDEDSQAKKITSLAIAGSQIIFLDDIQGTLGGGALNAALTTTNWTDRVLGKSEMTGSLPLTAVWFATGNNVTLHSELIRRVIHIRLATNLENPEDRSQFAYDALLEHVKKERRNLVRALLTIVRAYECAGKPKTPNVTHMGGYEGWTYVRQIVCWLKLADPADSQKILRSERDTEIAELRGIIEGVEEILARTGNNTSSGITASEMLDRARVISDSPNAAPRLRDVLLEYNPSKMGDLPSVKSLGMRLEKYRGRMCGGKKLVCHIHDGYRRWGLETKNTP